MVAQWADETPGSEPLPSLEPFFIFAAMQLGDPDLAASWRRTVEEFVALYSRYHKGTTKPVSERAAIIQYIVWYERNKPTTDPLDNKHTSRT